MADTIPTTPMACFAKLLPQRARWIVVAGLVFAAVGHVTSPERLVAESIRPRLDCTPLRDNFTQQLAERLADAHCVLAVCARGESGRSAVVLWLDDERNPGLVDPDEIVVLRHAPMLRAILWYRFDPGQRCEHGPLKPGQIVLNPAEFVGRWCSSTHVQPRFIVSGVSDMAAHITGSASNGAASVRVDLIWAEETSDGFMRTSATAPLREMRSGRRDGSGDQ